MIEQLKLYLRQPRTLAIAVPFLLGILLLVFFVKMNTARSDAMFQIQNVQDSFRYASEIKKLKDTNAGSAGENFSGISSVRNCAKFAGIAEENISRGESSKPSSRQDGVVLHRETYKISRVSLLQIAKFIDCAERNYSDLQCTQLALIPTPGVKSHDNWSATLSLTYTVK